MEPVSRRERIRALSQGAISPLPLATSGHVDTFARDHLPPAHQWPKLEFTLPSLQYPQQLNAASELIDVPIARFGADRPALRTPDGQIWSYGQLRTRANQVAQVLTEDLTLIPGQRVLLRSPNNPWAVAIWLGILKAGGVVVTTVPALRWHEISAIVDQTRPSIAVVDFRFTKEIRRVAEASSAGLTVVEHGGGSMQDLTARAAAKSGVFTSVQTSADDVALMGPTSGSTGTPKITMHFHRDILSIDNTFGRHVLKLAANDLVACSAPLAFTFGLGMLIVFPLRAGACALLTESASPLRLADIVEQLAVSVLATAPTAYRTILREGQERKLARLRAAVSAGEYLPRATWEQLRDRLGLRVIDGIGATELLHVFISAADHDIRPGAIGKPVPGYRAAIFGSDGLELGPGKPGWLGVIGPVGCRYLDDARQSMFVVDGWNLTGDICSKDEDDYFYYRSRGDDMIVSSGYNISGPEVEVAISGHPDVVECAVIGRPDAVRGSVVCAFVVLREGSTKDSEKAQEIQDYVKQSLAPFKYPRDVRFCDSLPRNTNGKVQHHLLRRLVEQPQQLQ
jgi:2-aminobenzoate-CoA ligase